VLYFFPFIPAVPAYAEEASSPAATGFASMLPLILLFVIFYFLLIRPQQKRAKEHREMVKRLEKGDSVVTSGGLHGRITSVSEDMVTMEVADNVRVKVTKDSVAARKPSG
jgi:preprotein translocase subunit YajC